MLAFRNSCLTSDGDDQSAFNAWRYHAKVGSIASVYSGLFLQNLFNVDRAIILTNWIIVPKWDYCNRKVDTDRVLEHDWNLEWPVQRLRIPCFSLLIIWEYFWVFSNWLILEVNYNKEREVCDGNLRIPCIFPCKQWNWRRFRCRLQPLPINLVSVVTFSVLRRSSPNFKGLQRYHLDYVDLCRAALRHFLSNSPFATFEVHFAQFRAELGLSAGLLISIQTGF